MFEIIDDTAGFERLRSDWTRLLEASAADCLFLTWEWLFTWWKHLSGERRLSVLVLRSRGELIAIAPFARVDRFRALTTFEFLGAGAVGSDYLDIIVRRGDDRYTLEALSACLSEYGGVFHLAQLKKPASAASELARLLERDGWRQLRRTTGICPFIRLADSSWESYLASLGAKHARNFNRRLQHANETFDVRFEQARSPEECREALNRLILLHNLRWQGRGGSDAFHTPEIVLFHDEMSRLALDRGWLRLYVLRFDDEPVAALYGFLYRHVFYFYQSGYDPRYRKHRPGLIAMGLAIKSAIEDGAKEYDMLHGTEPDKIHWAKEFRELEQVQLYPWDMRLIAKQTPVPGRFPTRTSRRSRSRSISTSSAGAKRPSTPSDLLR